MFSWKKVFNILKNPRLTNRTFRKYEEKAKKYPYCATGELRESLENVGYSFDSGSKPIDATIRTLSHAFYQAIQRRKFDEAETIYDSLVILSKGDPC